MKKLNLLISFILIFTASLSAQSNLKLKSELLPIDYKTTSLDNNTLQSGKKSPGLAILYSLLLPGMGELYAGNYSSGKYFTIAEGVLWGTYVGINSYASWKKDTYISFASDKGGVNTSGKDDNYYATISEYINIDDYNNDKALNREFDQMLDKSTYYWNWGGQQYRREYRNMWVSSEQSYNNLRFVVGALIANRIISAINAVRLVSAYNKNLNTENTVGIVFDYKQNQTIPGSFNINFFKSF